MKKLLVLFVVLALTTVASAATIDLVILGSDTQAGDEGGIPSYAPSTILTIGLVGNDVGVVSISAMSILGPGVASNIVVPPVWNNIPLTTGGQLVNDGTTLIEGINLTNNTDFVSNVPAGVVMYTFDYHVAGNPSDIIDISAQYDMGGSLDINFGNVTAINPLAIHVSPEPMTIALLGLGGLFLRRKK